MNATAHLGYVASAFLAGGKAEVLGLRVSHAAANTVQCSTAFYLKAAVPYFTRIHTCACHGTMHVSVSAHVACSVGVSSKAEIYSKGTV